MEQKASVESLFLKAFDRYLENFDKEALSAKELINAFTEHTGAKENSVLTMMFISFCCGADFGMDICEVFEKQKTA